MKVKVLGSRGKIEPSAPHYKNHSGFLIDDRILLDAGEAEYMDLDPEAVVFTHFHPDHAFFLFNREIFDPGIPLFGPERQECIPNLQLVYDRFTIYGYSFTPFPVIHALKLKSLGYLVEKDGRKVLFTGDIAWIEKRHLEDLPPVDLVITEATFINKGGRINRKKDRIFGHTGVPDLIRLLGPLTPKIVFTHYGEWFFEDVKDSIRRISDFSTEYLEVVPGFDGLEVEI